MENLLKESQLNSLQLNQKATAFLKEISKWTYFLSILGFVGIGFMVILAFSMGAIMSALPMGEAYGAAAMMGGGAFFTVFYLLMALLYFFPVYYLYKFSVNLKASLASSNDEELANAFEYLKSHYKFIGILSIILIGFYVLIFLFAGLGAAFM